MHLIYTLTLFNLMEFVYVLTFPVYVRSTLPRPMHFCLIAWFSVHISSVLLLQGTAMALRMYKPQYMTPAK